MTRYILSLLLAVGLAGCQEGTMAEMKYPVVYVAGSLPAEGYATSRCLLIDADHRFHERSGQIARGIIMQYQPGDTLK